MEKMKPAAHVVRAAADALYKGYPSLSYDLRKIATRLDRIEMFDAATACTASADPADQALAEAHEAADLHTDQTHAGQPVAYPPVGAQVLLMSGGPWLTVIMSGAVCEVAWFDRDERLQEAALPARALISAAHLTARAPAQDA